MKSFQEISIKHMDNGIKVKIGCKKLVYQQKDLKQFLKDLENYLNNPEETEKKIRARWKINADDPQTGFVTANYIVSTGISGD